MFAAIYLPDFSLQCALRDDPDAQSCPIPVAILEPSTTASERNKARIIALSPEAIQQGTTLGMTAIQGLARCADLLLLDRDCDAETKAQNDLLACAETFTADYESTAPGTAMLDLHGNLLTPESLATQAISWLAATNLTASVGTASTPDLAQLVATISPAATHQHLPGDPKKIQQFLKPLSIQTLPASAELVEVLHLWGIHSLGALTALGRGEIVSRLGLEAAALFDYASGTERRLLKLHRPPASFTTTLSLEHEIVALDPLLFYIRRMLDVITSRLAAAYRVAAALSLSLTFTDKTNYLRQFRIPEPTRDVDLLLNLLHAHLDNFIAKSSISALVIEAIPARPGRCQFDLFVSGLRDPNRFAETLARLEATLGENRVGKPEPIASHRPDSFTLHPFTEKTDAAAVPTLTKRIGLPLRRFRPPVQASVTLQDLRPSAIQSETVTAPIRHAFGPFLTSTDWWQKSLRWHQSEWDIELHDGTAYLLTSNRDEHWHLQGIY